MTSTKNQQKFVKLFINDIGRIHGLGESAIELLIFIVANMKLNNQFITQPVTLDKACETTGKSLKTIRALITELIKSGLLLRIASNIYMVNPYIAASGDEKSVNNKRALYMHIRYENNGETRKITTGYEDNE